MSLSIRTALASMLLTPMLAMAQAQPDHGAHRAAASASAPRSDAASAPAGKAATSAYRSAFDGYRRYGEQPVRSWREANDEVGRIGGWQAYAREAQGGPTAGSAPSTPAALAPAASSPGPSPTPIKAPPSQASPAPAAPASGAHSGGHSGHK